MVESQEEEEQIMKAIELSLKETTSELLLSLFEVFMLSFFML